MNRKNYFDFIENKLNQLAYRIEVRGKLNILDLNLHSENFYLHFFNLLFGWELKNLNTEQINAPGTDLVDTINSIVVQVSSTATKRKIESALSKQEKHKGFVFKFISISKDATMLQTQTFSNPYQLIFEPAKDIFDIPSLLRIIFELDIIRLKEIYEFLGKELKSESDPEKLESNLATIINILSKEDWSQGGSDFEKVPYDPEIKISYNQLDKARCLIEDYKIHYSRIDKIYAEFDRQGVNKSLSILNGIRTEYLALGDNITSDQCFFSIIENVSQKIRASANYTCIPDEELVLCVQLLVVDAFIRCKIFLNPSGGVDARS